MSTWKCHDVAGTIPVANPGQQRGRLKVYLGFAPGVGKTYEMLQEGQRLKRQGVDVVVGSSRRTDAPRLRRQIGDLEQCRGRQIEYRGVTLEEMDLDAVIKRKPTVALVDELAHTKRPAAVMQSVSGYRSLLEAGIHVISTMNVQHLESLYDLIGRFTGVKVKERVPDYVFGIGRPDRECGRLAEDLQDRLRSGKVYPQERIEASLNNFFQEANLSRLRELALEEIAIKLDHRRRERKGASESRSPSASWFA